jgi:chorismate mutase
MPEKPMEPQGDHAPAELADRMKTIRDKIDALDEQIVCLLNARAKCALDLGALKGSVGMATYQPTREREVLAHARQVNGGPLESGAITRLFERIIDENRRLERLKEERT